MKIKHDRKTFQVQVERLEWMGINGVRVVGDRSFCVFVDGHEFCSFDSDEGMSSERDALAAAVQVYNAQQSRKRW